MTIKTEAQRVDIEGRQMKCPVCSNETFHRRRSHVDTSLTCGMNPDWTDAPVWCLICERCGRMEWFLQR